MSKPVVWKLQQIEPVHYVRPCRLFGRFVQKKAGLLDRVGRLAATKSALGSTAEMWISGWDGMRGEGRAGNCVVRTMGPLALSRIRRVGAVRGGGREGEEAIGEKEVAAAGAVVVGCGHGAGESGAGDVGVRGIWNGNTGVGARGVEGGAVWWVFGAGFWTFGKVGDGEGGYE